MMGRSHALLGAAGYLGVVAVAGMDIPGSMPWSPHFTVAGVVAVTAAARISLSSMPAALYEAETSSRRRLQPGELDELEGIDDGTVMTRRTTLRQTGRRGARLVTGGAYGLFRKLFIQINLLLIPIAIAVGVGEYVPALIPDNALMVFLWMLVCAGWALAPDIDEPNSTVSRLFGPLSRAASVLIRNLAGGHRQATHSFAAAGLGLILALLATQFFILAGVLMTIAMVLATRMIFPDTLGKASAPVVVIGVMVAWMAALGSVDMWPLVLAVPLGVLLHLAGDYLTNSGIPATWPKPQRYAARMFGTNTRTEHLVVQPLLVLSLFLLICFIVILPGANQIEQIDGSQISDFMESIPSMNQLYSE